MYEYLGSRDDPEGYREDARRIVDLVSDGFAGRRPLVGPITRTPTGWDESALERDLGGLAWQDVSVEVVERHKDDLGFLTDAALALYIPAFIVASLKEPEATDVAMQSTLSILTPRHRRDRLVAFSDRELHALKEFVAFGATWYPEMVSRGLIDFWTARSLRDGVPDQQAITLPSAED